MVSVWNNNRRPDKSIEVSSPYDEKPYNGVRVTSEYYSGARASPPTMDKPYDGVHNSVRVRRAKGRINSTSTSTSALFIYACIRSSDRASSRSTVPATTIKSNSSLPELGYSNDASVSNFEKST